MVILKWLQSRKWVAVLLAVLLEVFGRKLGIHPDAVDGASLALLAGTGVEGLVDIARAFARKKEGV